jgi:K+-sensing histidine kinase KdpD
MAFLGSGIKKASVALSYVIGILIFLPLSQTRYFISGVYNYYWGYWFKAAIFHPLFLLFFATLAFASFYKLYRAIKEYVGYKKLQAKYLLTSFLIAYLAIVDFLPDYGIQIYPFGYLPVVFYVLIIGYAIVKYRLLDINVALTRAGIFAIVYTLVLGIPFLVGYRLAEKGSWIIALLLGMIVASTGPFVYQYLRRQAEDRLLKDQRRYQAILRRASGGMTLIKDLDKLLNLTVRVLARTVKIDYAGVYLFDKKEGVYILKGKKGVAGKAVEETLPKDNILIQLLFKNRNPILYEEVKTNPKAEPQMRKLHASLIVPSIIENDLLGFLVLGSKLSGQIYTEEDMNVFSILANETALAIENCQFLKEREEIQEKLRKAEKLIATYELLRSVRHEIGNILNLMSMPSQAIAMGMYKDKPDKEREAAKTITEKVMLAKQVLSYIDDYRTRTESDNIQSYDITDILSKSISDGTTKKLCEQFNIQIQTSINGQIPIIKGKDSFPDIFKHLIINSCYGMEQGGAIDIKVESYDNTVKITQSDTGVDLTKEIINHKTMGGELFAEQGKLGGLNLFLTRLIIQDHKGTLNIESNEGKGTRFVVSLPVDFSRV